MDLLLTGGLVYDGTGAAPLLRDIGIVDGRWCSMPPTVRRQAP